MDAIVGVGWRLSSAIGEVLTAAGAGGRLVTPWWRRGVAGTHHRTVYVHW